MKEKVRLIGITDDGYLKGEDSHDQLLELYPDRNCEDSLANLIAHTLYPLCNKQVSKLQYPPFEVNVRIHLMKYPFQALRAWLFQFPDSFLPQSVLEKFKKMPIFISSSKIITESLKNFDEYALIEDKESAFILFSCELIKLIVLATTNTRTFTASKTQYNDFIQQIISYIDRHIYEDITLEDLSKSLNFSKSHLCNQFKKYMKISLIDYVRHKKIFVAESLIKTGVKKNVVAQELGFKDYSTFYRQYKKITAEKK